MDSLIGSTIAHYKIVRKIGSGGMGVVYEAEDTSLGRRVALKFLPEDLAQDTQSLERFQREARAASALNHPNICTVYAIEQHERQHFIAMELLEGQTLAQMIGRQPFPLAQTLALAIQIADALESAHAKGIVHRDIKPANIFVNTRGQVKVLDFGLAKIEGARGAAAGSAPGSQMETRESRDELTIPGTTMGTVAYMSPEQARGQLADARTDLFSLGAVLYQMASGVLPFQGDTSAVIYEAILNRAPAPLAQLNPSVPPEFAHIVDKALEKDRAMRYQTATDLKTDLVRLKRDAESGGKRAGDSSDARGAGTARQAQKSVAVLYFENLSGVKEDEYFRDGITEDIITELSKIRGLNIFSRPTVLAFRDKSVTPAQIGQQLKAAYVLSGSLRRAGSRLRINAQLIDTQTDFPLWSERYDREMKDVFEVQDEIARKIAEALRITLSPQEQAAISAKPTEDLQAYDLYLRGKSYARRLTRQDLEFALQMFENAVAQDPNFALGYAAIANVCAQNYYHYLRETSWIGRAMAASQKAVALQPDQPEVLVAQAWILYASNQYDDAVRSVRAAIERKRDCEGAYYLLGRALFASGSYQELINIAEEALEASGSDYNVYVPIVNALGALGKDEMLRNVRLRRVQAMEDHLKRVPEDARARTILSVDYASINRVDDALREVNLAMALRPTEATVLYNVACIYCMLNKKPEALDALSKAWNAGFKDADWARRDPDLALLHGDPEFERLYPPPKPS
jgi:serine/threonine protein kinase/Tfp pilus assembly protein PilF